jgi:hypothetical protein
MSVTWVEAIVYRTAQSAGVRYGEVMGAARGREAVSDARKVVYYLLFAAGLSYTRIGEIMGRHHTTVFSGTRDVANAIGDRDVNPALYDLYIQAASLGTVKEKLFFALLRADRLPLPEAEYRFHPTRRWRLDYCWPAQGVALEIEGGVWIGGRHNRASGYVKDMEKYNAWAARGGRLLRVTPDALLRQETIDLIKQTLGATP